MKPLVLSLILAALTGCHAAAPTIAGPSPAAEDEDGLVRIGLHQTASVGGPKVTPLQVLEDSRCPADVTCVVAGQVRLRVHVTLGSGSALHELTTGQPIPVADGTLELVEVNPPKSADAPIAPGEYRFAFRFIGGL